MKLCNAVTHQSIGLTSSERGLGRAVGSAAVVASCLPALLLYFLVNRCELIHVCQFWRGTVFTAVCLYVCLFVGRITKKVMR